MARTIITQNDIVKMLAEAERHLERFPVALAPADLSEDSKQDAPRSEELELHWPDDEPVTVHMAPDDSLKDLSSPPEFPSLEPETPLVEPTIESLPTDPDSVDERVKKILADHLGTDADTHTSSGAESSQSESDWQEDDEGWITQDTEPPSAPNPVPAEDEGSDFTPENEERLAVTKAGASSSDTVSSAPPSLSRSVTEEASDDERLRLEEEHQKDNKLIEQARREVDARTLKDEQKIEDAGVPEAASEYRHGEPKHPIESSEAGATAQNNVQKNVLLSNLDGPKPDSFTTRLLKYIPAEVIALYLTLDALIRSSDKIGIEFYWGVFFFGIIGTFLYLWRVEKVEKKSQLMISAGAYCVWVFALGGPFVHLAWYEPIYAGILLPIYTFTVPIIEG